MPHSQMGEERANIYLNLSRFKVLNHDASSTVFIITFVDSELSFFIVDLKLAKS